MAIEPKASSPPQPRPLHRQSEEVRVVIYTENFKIIGTIKIPVGGRLTDFLNKSVSNNKDTFLAITNAECYEECCNKDNDSTLRYTAEFMTVHRDHIYMIIPTDKIKDARTHPRTPNPNKPQKP